MRKRIANYDEKLSVIAERYLDYDVRAITGTTCWFTLLFEKVLAGGRKRAQAPGAFGLGSVAEPARALRRRRRGNPYLPVIRELVGRDVTLVDTYNATEGGVYATSDFSGASGMLVLPHRGTFFEFVPARRARRRPRRRASRSGRSNVAVLTPSCRRHVSGLYAYSLGDIVRFPQTSLRFESSSWAGCPAAFR